MNILFSHDAEELWVAAKSCRLTPGLELDDKAKMYFIIYFLISVNTI